MWKVCIVNDERTEGAKIEHLKEKDTVKMRVSI